MTIISLLKCNNYKEDDLLNSIEQSCKNINFNPADIAGAKIAVKPNLLTAVSPESGVVTHPEFFRAVIRFIKAHKGIPILVESPAFFSIDKVINKCGYSKIITDEKIEIAKTKKTVLIKNEENHIYKSFNVAEDIISSDFIFNLPKLKTHSLTYFTGAVKNFFGLIHGLEKTKWHVKTETQQGFISFLLDLYSTLLYHKKNQIITIMDGILGLEGNGPGTSGKPKFANAIIAGTDAIAVDAIAVTVAGLDLTKTHLCIDGEKRKLGISSIDKIKLSGASLNNFNNNFIPPDANPILGSIFKKLPVIKDILVDRPIPDKKKCSLCYQCKSICPAGVIEKSLDKIIPLYNYNKCIRCYCCMEICPEGAISLKRRLL
jgi:uncharacterized protein (DUF362 family)/Pyruvate/2-oxoacid:ferredoxin oxidoreductase delta subunit